ncbi:fungal-specific transcription factor domain-containing protein [Bisporella sp. PMI_857]|nr:fungal-specific transcription factor domain-containing protein [Bisporella sp. PMI_857]
MIRKFSVLPPSEVLATLIDVYFSRCHNQPYSFFHEQNFRIRLVEGKIPDYLLFAVMATSLRFSTNLYFQGELQEAAASYARESWSQIVSTWFATESDPNLHICQAITVLSILDFTAGRKHPAWLKIGLSIRIAQDLRMMMEPDPALSFADQEEHRRVFWSIYVLDKLCSCGRARPASIIDAHCHVQLPCGESNFRDGRWEDTPSLSEALTPEKHTELGDLALVVLTACIIGKCAQHSIHSNGPDSNHIPPWDSKSDFAAIYSKLLLLETQYDMGSRINNRLANCIRHGVLDMPIAGPLVYSHALFHMSQCLLHHPFLLSNQSRTGAKPPVSFLNRAMQTSRENANSIFALVQDAKNAGYPIYFSFMGYVVSVAGSINMLYLQDEDAGVCGQALISFQSGMEYLEELAKYWKCGARMV